MNKRVLALLLLGVIGARPFYAQTEPPVADAGAEIELLALEDLEKPRARPQVLAQLRQSFLDDADKVRAWRLKRGGFVRARVAKRLEAVMLLRAAEAGDTSNEVRRQRLVDEVRADKLIEARKRCELVAREAILGVERKGVRPFAEKLADYEAVSRSLAAEFPEVPDSYASLVQIAKHAASDEQEKKILRDVLAMPATAGIKAEARAMLNRHALLGQSLSMLVQPILGEGNPVEKGAGKRIVVYSWASDNQESIDRARTIAQQARPETVVIGVCLDRIDLSPAKELVAAQSLPGFQVYDWLGRKGELAQQLAMTDPGLVYVTDANAVISTVSAQRNVAQALN